MPSSPKSSSQSLGGRFEMTAEKAADAVYYELCSRHTGPEMGVPSRRAHRVFWHHIKVLSEWRA